MSEQVLAFSSRKQLLILVADSHIHGAQYLTHCSPAVLCKDWSS